MRELSFRRLICSALLLSGGIPSAAQIVIVPTVGGSFFGGAAAVLAGPSLQAPALSPSLSIAAPSLAASLPAASAAFAAVPAPAAIPAASVPISAGPKHTLTGDVRFIRNFRSEALGNSRTVAVYLPPGYETSNERYPVLYAHDGQNLFDAATAYGGNEWGLDETAEKLIRSGELPPFIIVAPYNAGDERLDEMTWIPDPEDGGGKKGELYADFLIKELKPYIDSNLRTLPEDSRLLGSSLGGLISLHIARTRPGIFSAVGAMSASIFWADREITKRYAWSPLPNPRPRIWLDMGTREGQRPERWPVRVEEAVELGSVLRARGWREGDDLAVRVIDGARHDEISWGERVGDVLKFLFPIKRRP
jgi:predicted alpha/beta superfamily hydrolase